MARGGLKSARWLVPVGALLLLGCATTVTTEKMRRDRYRLRCEGPLRGCLTHADALCGQASFDVLRGRDRRHYTGATPAEVEHRSSEAIIECRSRGVPLFEEDDLADHLAPSELPPRPAAQEEPAAPKAVCTPGATQACVGIGGCAGGQACLPDGSALGECRCAEPETPLDAPAPTVPEAGDSAPDGAAKPPAGPPPGVAKPSSSPASPAPAPAKTLPAKPPSPQGPATAP